MFWMNVTSAFWAAVQEQSAPAVIRDTGRNQAEGSAAHALAVTHRLFPIPFTFRTISLNGRG